MILLEKVAGVSRHDRLKAQDAATEFARGLVRDSYDYKLPEQGSDLTIEQSIALVNSFRENVLQNPSDGDIAINFSDLVLYIIGSSLKLNELQKQTIISVCALVKRRPLPVLRWSQFVLSNLHEPERLRSDLTACNYSKRGLAYRLEHVVQREWPKTGLPTDPRVLAIGYSKTVASVLKGMAKYCSHPLKIFAPAVHIPGRRQSAGETLKSDFEAKKCGIDVQVIKEAKVLELCKTGQVDVIVMGCKVIGRIDKGKIEVVNSWRCVELFRKACDFQVPVVVTAGLYKIWPADFYKQQKKFTVEWETNDGELANGILVQKDINWFVTERGILKASDFATAAITRPYFEIHNFQVPCILTACKSSEKFKYAIDNIDSILAELAMEKTKGEYEDLEIHSEALEYWKDGKLPEHFRYAQEYYQMKIKDDNWYRDNEGIYVAIMAKNTVEAEVKVHKDLDELLRIAYKEWGYRPIFATRVSKKKMVITLRPRFGRL